MNVVRFLLLMKALLLVGGTALSQNRTDSLFARLDRPATVAGHNSPSTFAKHLDKVNERLRVLAPSAEGSNPLDSDVWVLFLRNEGEVQSLPKIVQEVYWALPEAADEPASRYVEFQLSNGDQKAASFHFLESYGTDSEEVIACKAAIAVYGGVIGNSDSLERELLTKECESLM